MAYNLMVFEISNTPESKKEFIDWYEHLTNWSEDIDYNDPSNATIRLQNWFNEMIVTFPPMNGPLAPTDEEIDDNEELEMRLTDYSIATEAIYAAFALSLAENAYNIARELSDKHGIGFFDVSGKEDVTFPDGTRFL